MGVDVSCDGGDVSCDGGVVIWRQMCHVMEVWSYGGRCVM